MAGAKTANQWLASCCRRSILVGAVLLLISPASVNAESTPFENASVRFEQNATDGDVEVVFEVTGGDDGLAKLTVVAPDGRIVVDFHAPDASTLGIRQFEFESPEPGDVESLKSAYPEGVYTFAGATAAGDAFHGESRLSHGLPATASILRPGSAAVSADGLEIAWTPVEGLAAYIVEIEQDELGVSVTARLPASETRFSVPDGFLRPGREYQLGLGTVMGNGNASFIEMTFTTADE